MNLQLKEYGPVRVLELTGDLKGGEEIDSLKLEVDAELRAGARLFVIDLARVGLVNSLGIGLLVACLTAVRKRGGEMKFCGASHRVVRALDHCRLLDVVGHHPTVQEAVKSLEVAT